MVLSKLTGKMLHKSHAPVVRNLSLILRLNIPPNSKYLVLPVLEVPYNSDLSTNFLDLYAFDLQIATFSFFTSLLDSVCLLLLEVIQLILSGFPLIRFAHLFLVLNSSLSFLKMEDPNDTHSRGKQTLSTISSTQYHIRLQGKNNQRINQSIFLKVAFLPLYLQLSY